MGSDIFPDIGEVARSSFYDFMNRGESNSRDMIYLEKLKTYVKAIFKESKGTYGTRRIKPALASQYGIYISRKSTAKVMKMCGVIVKSTRCGPIKVPEDILRRGCCNGI